MFYSYCHFAAVFSNSKRNSLENKLVKNKAADECNKHQVNKISLLAFSLSRNLNITNITFVWIEDYDIVIKPKKSFDCPVFKVNRPFARILCLSVPGRELPVITVLRSTTAIRKRLRQHPTQYSPSVLFSVILSTAGRYLSVRTRHVPADYEYFDPNIWCFPVLFRISRCAWDRQRILKVCRHTGLRYCLRRAQATHIPRGYSITPGGTHELSNQSRIYSLHWHRLGWHEARYLFTACQ